MDAFASTITGTLTSAFSGAALAATAIGAATSAISFGIEGVAAAESDIKATQKLESVLASTGNAAGVTSDEINDLASQLQRVTKYEDDATVNAAALLASFKNIKGDEFLKTLKSAQDLAAVKDIGLDEAVTTLGKALFDPTEGVSKLHKAGVYLTDSQEELIKSLSKTGDTLGAQQVMLAALEETYGGAAERTVTATEKIGLAWGDLKETIGKELLPSVELFSNTIVPAFYGASDAAKELGEESETSLFSVSSLMRLTPGGMGPVSALTLYRDTVKYLNETLNEGKEPVQEFGHVLEEVGDIADEFDWTTFGEDIDSELTIDKEFKKKLTDMTDELAILRGEATKTGVELRKMIEGGLSTTETDQLQALHDQIEAEKELAATAREKSDAEEKLNEQADAVRASVMTPEEKAAEKKAELQALLDAGKIDQETFDRATKTETADTKDDTTPAGSVGAAAKGSAEAMSSIFAAMRAKDSIPQKQLAAQQRSVELQEETVAILRDGGLGAQFDVGGAV